MNIILFDTPQQWKNLLPLTYTRPISNLRCGILTIDEKWKLISNAPVSYKTTEYLTKKYPCHIQHENIFIDGSILPDNKLFNAISSLKPNEVLLKENRLIAIKLHGEEEFNPDEVFSKKCILFEEKLTCIEFPWDIFINNASQIQNDIQILFKNKKSLHLSSTNQLLGRENIYVEEGVKAEYVTINATKGPVYLGKDCEIMEGTVIRGPFAMCNNSTLKISTKIYGPVTLGPHSKAGGEISESVIYGYTNKAHDGYLGNSVIGEWCNLGADTNTSNLKNNYEQVKVWNYHQERFVNSGLQFCGLIMGDHSKCGINTMFNTGSVVGVSANIFGAGFPRNFIPSFSWGGAQGMITYKPEKAFEVAEKVMARRNIEFNNIEQDILNAIFEDSAKFRR